MAKKGKKKAKRKRAAHPGFEGAAREISRRQGISMERARKILASKTRGASAAAKRKNPRLRKVKG